MSSENETTAFEELLGEYYEVCEKIKLLEAMKKKQSEKIKVGIATGNALGSTLAVGQYTVQVTPMPGRTTYDTAAMKQDGIDVSKYAKVGAPFATVTVKKVLRVS